MNFWVILYAVDWLLFIPVAFTVVYMTVFTVASAFHKQEPVPKAKRQNRFIVLIPAYKRDDTIEQTVKSILGQTYPQRLFDVIVISDHQKEITNFRLAQYPITLLTPDFRQSTKGKSLQYAMNNLPQFKIYDIVVLLDADNVVLPEFLEELNNGYEHAGTKAVQTHRVSKNRDTAFAILDATFEEIYNTIFRLGHTAVGLPAAIAGSGLALDFTWFKENIVKTRSTWEDKELEALLMRQHVYVDYLKDVPVFDEKTRSTREFNRQRGRWATAQFHTVMRNIRFLPSAVLHKQYDLVDKIIQWLLMPRSMMMGVIALMSIVLPFIYLSLAVKWWVTAAFILFVFALATPDYLVDKQWERAFFKSPFIMVSSLLYVFKVWRGNKSFINTSDSK